MHCEIPSNPLGYLGRVDDVRNGRRRGSGQRPRQRPEQHDHDDFVTFIAEIAPGLDKADLLARVTRTIAAHDILRIKGFADVKGSDSRLLLQAVGPRLNELFEAMSQL